MTKIQVSSGSSYLKAVLAAESKCESDTDIWIKEAHGKRFPKALDLLGLTLEIIEQAACCYWGCENPSHDLEKLAARVYSQASGALRLARTGRYDEALALIRSIGELVNLLALFALEPQKREEWQQLDDRERRQKFTPLKVRIAIEAKKIDPPIKSDEYSYLCEQAVHPTPSALPGGYNTKQIPVLGGHLQPEGVIVVMCSLVRAIGRCAIVLSNLMELPTEQAKSLLVLGMELDVSLGGHTAESMRERIRTLAENKIN
ncbi:hypothetical protein [Methyloglobulus sp.]|uniref:hypothetical protein n=1 Tax=Methyloglobulus sp. TaxID=2518622 RepID=UPI0032B880C5